MEKTTQLYEGKAKKVWATDNANIVIVDYKDDATAFNGVKKGTIVGSFFNSLYTIVVQKYIK